jgi:hypothetical protein
VVRKRAFEKLSTYLVSNKSQFRTFQGLSSRSTLELQRYFHAAEEAAREIMLEEAINAQQHDSADKDGVFQLTTLSSLPLKSPKRLIALQLANNNPAFRERFRQKLEQSGGPLAMGKHSLPQHSLSASMLLNAGNGNSQYSSSMMMSNHNMWSSQGMTLHTDNNDSNASFEGELERLINTPDWNYEDIYNQNQSRVTMKSMNTSNIGMVGYPTTTLLGNFSQIAHEPSLSDSRQDPSSGKKDKKGSAKKARIAKDSADETDDANKPLKLRQKRRKELDLDIDNDSLQYDSSLSHNKNAHMMMHQMVSGNPMNVMDNNINQMNIGGSVNQTSDGSIIKRRRKGELQIMVDGALGLGNNQAPAGPLTTAIKNNLHSLLGGGLPSEMGPPGDTPRRSARLKSGNMSTVSNLGNVFLDSPFLDKNLLFSDGFGVFADTPSKLMHLDPPLSKSATATNGEGVRFDFDEAVAAHFPSPRAGEHIKGNSPYRWSGSSVGSTASGFFNFPDGAFPSAKGTSSSAFSSDTPSAAGSDAQNEQHLYAKKFKKAVKKEDGTDFLEPFPSASGKPDNAIFQSPTHPQGYQKELSTKGTGKVS